MGYFTNCYIYMKWRENVCLLSKHTSPCIYESGSELKMRKGLWGNSVRREISRKRKRDRGEYIERNLVHSRGRTLASEREWMSQVPTRIHPFTSRALSLLNTSEGCCTPAHFLFLNCEPNARARHYKLQPIGHTLSCFFSFFYLFFVSFVYCRF